MYKIEKGIPIPYGKSDNGERRTAAEKLEVGESFLIPGTTEEIFRTARNLAYNVRYKTGRKFRTRKLADGIRIWRIS